MAALSGGFTVTDISNQSSAQTVPGVGFVMVHSIRLCGDDGERLKIDFADFMKPQATILADSDPIEISAHFPTNEYEATWLTVRRGHAKVTYQVDEAGQVTFTLKV